MVYVVSKKFISKENQPTFLKMAEEMVACTRKEEGCMMYVLTASRTVENILVYMERWETQAHLDAHMKSEHFKRLGPVMNALCEGTELTVLEDAFDLAAE